MNAPAHRHPPSLLAELGATASELWWRFVDWVAVLSWPKLALLWFLVLAVAGPLGMPGLALIFIAVSLGTKVLAGGKRRADIAARRAAEQAKVESLERRLVEARLAALQAQVEPHFLFNTLALIGRLMETDPAEAARLHNNLVDYLRAALPQIREPGGSTLGKQLDMARAYLAIMQARMKQRLQVNVDVPESLGTLPFPPMMLQVLVENAIKHGLEPKPEGGTIELRARAVDDMLHVEVVDSGIGFDLHAPEGVGLSNVRERLRILYGSRAQLVIEAPLQGGARVAIQVPAAGDAGAPHAPHAPHVSPAARDGRTEDAA